jgi:hypothetical protein
MNTVAWIVLLVSGCVSAYAIGVSLWTARALKRKEYEAYKEKKEDFRRLDDQVRKAFEDSHR